VGTATTLGGVVTVVVWSALTTGDAPPFEVLSASVTAPMNRAAATDAAIISVRTRWFRHCGVEIVSLPSNWESGETQCSPTVADRPPLRLSDIMPARR
jgi:hypothetical protein